MTLADEEIENLLLPSAKGVETDITRCPSNGELNFVHKICLALSMTKNLAFNSSLSNQAELFWRNTNCFAVKLK